MNSRLTTICRSCPAILLAFSIIACSQYPERVLLPVRHNSGFYDILCSVSMVLGYYGDRQSPNHLAELVNKPGDTLLSLTNMVEGLKTIGYTWEIKRMAIDHKSFEDGLNEIRKDLSENRPVLISTTLPPGGHVLVVVGYDDTLGRISLLDSRAPRPGLRVIAYDHLERFWHNEGNPELRELVITWPKK